MNVILLIFVLRSLGFSPFAAGAGALFYTSHAAGQQLHTYEMHFSPAAALASLRFYGQAALFLPELWIVLVLLPLLVRDRRVSLGMVLTLAMFVCHYYSCPLVCRACIGMFR